MNLDQTPHPLVEDHYHIRDLIETQEKRVLARKHWQKQKADLDGFEKYIAGFKPVEFLDFYCNHCELDFTARAHIQIDSWSSIAYYKIKHRCGTWSIRNVTDRDLDNYFYRSKKVAYDRATNSNDLVQEFETGFNMLYGKQERN